MNKASKDTEAMTTNLREWMNVQGWANLNPYNVMRYACSLNLGADFELTLATHMDNAFSVFKDDAVAGMAGCMFVLGVTFEEDDWS